MNYKVLDTFITASNTEVTFNREQFRAYRKNQISLAEVKFQNRVLLAACSDESLKKICVFILACTISVIKNNPSYAASCFSPTGAKVDALGNKILIEMRRYIKWLCIIVGLGHMTKAGLAGGDKKSIITIGAGYVLIYLAFYLFPSILDWIDEIFLGV